MCVNGNYHRRYHISDKLRRDHGPEWWVFTCVTGGLEMKASVKPQPNNERNTNELCIKT